MIREISNFLGRSWQRFCDAVAKTPTELRVSFAEADAIASEDFDVHFVVMMLDASGIEVDPLDVVSWTPKQRGEAAADLSIDEWTAPYRTVRL